jgi:hypothetical protein
MMDRERAGAWNLMVLKLVGYDNSLVHFGNAFWISPSTMRKGQVEERHFHSTMVNDRIRFDVFEEVAYW